MINGGQTSSSGGGVESLNLLTGALELIAGTNIIITPLGNTITIDATSGGGGIASINGDSTPAQIINAPGFSGLLVSSAGGTTSLSQDYSVQSLVAPGPITSTYNTVTLAGGSYNFSTIIAEPGKPVTVIAPIGAIINNTSIGVYTMAPGESQVFAFISGAWQHITSLLNVPYGAAPLGASGFLNPNLVGAGLDAPRIASGITLNSDFDNLSGTSGNLQIQINNLVSGYNNFSTVAVATTNKTIASPGAINWDGITPANGDVVFLLPAASGGSQTTASEGGLYTYNGAASPLTRISGMNTWSEITGSRINVDAGGVTFENTVWLNTNNNTGTIDVTAVTYLQNYNNYIAGTNLQLTGNVFSAPGEVYSNLGNTPGSLVSRDGFGESHANLADSATSANVIGVGPDTTDTLAYPLFVNNLGPSFQGARTNSAFNYNAVTNTLTVNVAGYATTADLTAGLALKADLASPALTGIPTAPTASQGTSTLQLATTDFVTVGLATKEPLITLLPITKGGSGQATANAALNAFLPTQTSQSGKVLGTDGTNTFWVSTSSGSVTSVSVVSANGFSGTVANPTTTPAITLQTTIAGLLKGDGTAISAAVAADIPITNTFTNNIGTNTMTSTVNGVPSSATLLSGVSASFNAPNSMRVQVNAFISDGLIIGSNTLALAGTALTSAVNGVNATAVQVCPSGQSISSAITFTTLTEVLLLVAPSVNAAGTYILRLVSGANELVIEFTIGSNAFTSYNQSRIQILQVTDSAGVINATNIGNYLLFRGYLRTNAPNNYFAVTVSTPYTLLYTNPITMTVYQNGASYLNENFTITNMITTDIANLVSLAPANLIFRMKTAYVPVTNYNPQGYLYVPGSGSAAIFQYSINNLTGATTALTPASFATTAPYKIAITQLRNFIYGVVATGTSVFQFAINPTSGILSALAPATVTGPNTCTGIIVDPTDRFVYACGFGTGIFGQWSITKTTGQLVAIASPPTAAPQMQDLVCHPSGKWLYAINNSNGLVYQYSITPATGALVALGTPTITAGTGPIMIVVHPSGLFAYVLNNGSATISQYSINTTTGQLTALAPATFVTGANPQGICISANGRFIYYTSQTTNTLSQSTINLTTGLIGTPTTSQVVIGAKVCCFDFSGSFIYVVNNTLNQVASFSINQTTGAMTSIGAVATGTNVNNIITA